jgi:hypothetical protein
MLRYRVLLVDTEAVQERPVQAICNNVPQVSGWAKATLATASKHSYVVVYRVTELEVGTIKKSDYDQSSVSRVQPAGKEANQPAS